MAPKKPSRVEPINLAKNSSWCGGTRNNRDFQYRTSIVNWTHVRHTGADFRCALSIPRSSAICLLKFMQLFGNNFPPGFCHCWLISQFAKVMANHLGTRPFDFRAPPPKFMQIFICRSLTVASWTSIPENPFPKPRKHTHILSGCWNLVVKFMLP